MLQRVLSESPRGSGANIACRKGSRVCGTSKKLNTALAAPLSLGGAAVASALGPLAPMPPKRGRGDLKAEPTYQEIAFSWVLRHPPKRRVEGGM